MIDQFQKPVNIVPAIRKKGNPFNSVIFIGKDELVSLKPNARYGLNMDVSRNTTLNVFDIRGHHLGSICMMGIPTATSVMQQLHARNFKSGVYFVQSVNKAFGKMIQVK